MRIAAIKNNDATNGEGVCVSFWVQGCDKHCPGCHNPETWDFNGGYETPYDLKGTIVKALCANDVQRNFSILGGEPLNYQNREGVLEVLSAVRIAYPHIKIFLWTGFTLKELLAQNNAVINSILDKINVLIDGPFIQEKKDLKLKLRGSSNQKIWEKLYNAETGEYNWFIASDEE